MSAPTGRRNNILAGVFLLGSLAVAVMLSFMLSGVAESWGSYTRYSVWFPLRVGAPGIKPGSPVHLGGQPVGRVEAVHREMTGDLGPRIVLSVLVASDVTLYPDTKAYLEQPLLGTLSSINIRWVGLAETGPALAEGALLKGGVAPPSFLESAGFGTDQQEKVQTIVQRVQELVYKFYASLDETDAQIQPILARADQISADVAQITSRLTQEIEGWTGDIDTTLANIREGSEQIEPILADVDRLLLDAEEFMAAAQAVIDDNRDEIDRIVANVETTTQRVNDETLPLVNQTVEGFGRSADDLSAMTTDARTRLAEEIPNLRRTIANMRLASDQMKLLLAEVRAAPWRLLERPTTREMEAQLYYDATRAYALAVSDLRAASESLMAARASGAASPEVLERLLAELEVAFQTYQQVESRMLEQIPRTAP